MTQKYKIGDEVYALEFRHPHDLKIKKIKVRVIETVGEKLESCIYHGGIAICDYEALTKEEAKAAFNNWIGE